MKTQKHYAGEHGQIVVMVDVHMDAPKRIRAAVDDIPLNGLCFVYPFVAVNFNKYTAIIFMLGKIY